MIRTRQYTTSAFSLCLLGLAAACGEEDVDTPTAEDYGDIAESVAPLIRKELAVDGGLMLSAQVAVGETPGWLSIDASGEVHHGAVGSLSWDLSASCADANGQADVACGETVSSAQVTSSLRGTLMLPNYSAELSADCDWSVSGLQSATILAKGKTNVHAQTRFTGLFRPVMRSFELDFAASYDVSIPQDAPQLASGGLKASIDARRVVSGTDHDSDAHFVVDASVALDGKGNAILTLDGDATFQLNLDSGQLVRIEGSVGG